MKIVKLGLIGCGARMHSILNKIPGLNDQIYVKGIFDPNEESVEKMKKRFRYEVKSYDNYVDLISDPEIRWVFIASWNCYHREHAIAAARAGKNIFCEKPLATNIEDCVAIFNAVKEAGVEFIIGFTLRFSPHYETIRTYVNTGKLGKIISFEFNEILDFNHGGHIMGNWRRLTKNAGSHLLEKCCHDLDIAHWIVGSLPKRVASFGGLDFFIPNNKKRIDEVGIDKDGHPGYMNWRFRNEMNPFTSDKDIVDNQVAIIEYFNGVHATFHTNCNSAIPERRIYIAGSEGTLRADVMEGTIEYKAIGFESETLDLSTGSKGGHGGGDVVLGFDIANAILKDTPSRTNIEDGLISAITAFAIDKAMLTGKVIDMSDDWVNAGFLLE